MDRLSLDNPPPNPVLSQTKDGIRHRDSGVFTGLGRLFPGEANAPAISNYLSEKDTVRLSFANAIYLAGEIAQQDKVASPKPEQTGKITLDRSTITAYLMKHLNNKFREQAKKKIERLVSALDEVRLFSQKKTLDKHLGFINYLMDIPSPTVASPNDPAAEPQLAPPVGFEITASSSLSSVDINTEPDKGAEMAGFLAVERTDRGFKNVMNCLMEISTQNCLSQIIHNMLIWRASEVHGNMAESGQRTTRGVKKTDQAKLAQNEERHQLAVDFIFCCTIMALLENAMTDINLEDQFCIQLEALAIENFKPVTRPEKTIFWERRSSEMDDSSIYAENKKQVGELFCSIVSQLSEHRLRQISTLFLTEVSPLINTSSLMHGSNAKNVEKAVAIIQGMRFIRLKINDKHNVETSIECVNHFFNMLQKAQKSEIKQALIDTLGNVLEMLVSSTIDNKGENKENGTIEMHEWQSLMKGVHEFTEPKRHRKSTKDMLSYPLMVCSLCLCDKEYFLSNWSHILIEHLVKKSAQDKSRRNRSHPIALRSAHDQVPGHTDR